MNKQDKSKEQLKSDLKELQQKYDSLEKKLKEDSDKCNYVNETWKSREAVLLAIIENQPGLVWLKDEQSRFLMVNEKFSKSCGIENPDLLIGKTDFDIWPPEFAAKYVADDIKVMESKTDKIVEELISDKGTVDWFETYKAPILDKNDKVIGTSGYSRNITSRKQVAVELMKAKERAEESEAQTKDILLTAMDGFWLVNLEGKFIDVNEVACKMLGYTREEMLKKEISDVEIAETAEETKFHRQKVLECGEDRFESKYRCKNGQFIDVEVSVKIEAARNLLITFVRDITERKLADNRLSEWNSRFEKLSANAPGLIFQFTRKPDGTYCVPIASEGIRDIFGCSPEDVLDDFTPIANVIYPEDASRVIADIEYSAKHLTFFTCEFRVQIPEKEIQWIYSKSTPEKLTDGSITWFGFNTDITERKLAEEKLNEYSDSLKIKNLILTDFCNIVSHNLRGPLVNISMLVDFIENSASEEERKELIGKFNPVLKGLNETFNELVESLQVKNDLKVSSENIDVKVLLTTILEGMQTEIDKSGAIIEINTDDAAVINFPKKYLDSILMNLVSNCFKYKSPLRKPIIKIKTEKIEDTIVLSIADNGLGIDLKLHQNDLFKIRKVFHEHPEAKGFGLFMTKTQIDAMDGKIWVESFPDEGSTFFVEFKNQKL